MSDQQTAAKFFSDIGQAVFNAVRPMLVKQDKKEFKTAISFVGRDGEKDFKYEVEISMKRAEMTTKQKEEIVKGKCLTKSDTGEKIIPTN